MADSRQRRLRTVIIADDLTGACDSAVHFAERGVATEVVLDWQAPVPETATVCSINANTRCLNASEAAERVSALGRVVTAKRPGVQIVKKVDSLLRGNIREELAAIRSALSLRMTVLAPAIPRLGRRVVGGEVHTDYGERIAIAQRLDGLKIASLAMGSQEQVTERIASAIGDRCEVLVADSASNEDLRALVIAGLEHRDLLWAGASGLMEAFAAEEYGVPAEHAAPPRLPLLLCTGSDHAITRSQLDALRLMPDVEFFEANPSACERVNSCLQAGRSAALIFSSEQLAPLCLRTLMRSCDLNACGALLLTGGDTAAAILRALDVEKLEMIAQILPGVPWARAVGGEYSGLKIMSKSGAFGLPDCLLECLRICGQSGAGCEGKHE